MCRKADVFFDVLKHAFGSPSRPIDSAFGSLVLSVPSTCVSSLSSPFCRGKWTLGSIRVGPVNQYNSSSSRANTPIFGGFIPSMAKMHQTGVSTCFRPYLCAPCPRLSVLVRCQRQASYLRLVAKDVRARVCKDPDVSTERFPGISTKILT